MLTIVIAAKFIQESVRPEKKIDVLLFFYNKNIKFVKFNLFS